MFHLTDLLSYSFVIIQCHDNPDADTISCAFALSRYFEQNNLRTRLIYSGFNRISKPNIAGLVDELNIPLEFVGRDVRHVRELAPEEENPLLITVDCQYGAGNVSQIECGRVCVIDHHIQEKDLADYTVIEPYLGSCATVVWRLLTDAGFDFTGNRDVSTALYYGLYTDTNSLSEIFHPVDRDMLEDLHFDVKLIRKLKGNNLTREELIVASSALNGARYDEIRHTVLFDAEPCDPNILGFISDLALQVEGVDTCVGFCEINGGVKLSIRSATYSVMAHELAEYLTKSLGSGGGNKEKAGGFFRLPEQSDAGAYVSERLRSYFSAYDKIVAGEYIPQLDQMKKYRKKALMVGYVTLDDIYPVGTDVTVRTIEGDATFSVSKDTYLMVGIQGETYPIQKAKFERTYKLLDGEFFFEPEFITEAFYAPTVKDNLYCKPVDLQPYIRPCTPAGETFICAKPVERDTKVFTDWYTEGYMFGNAGDYLAVRSDDPNDVYLINARIFELTYDQIL